MAIPTGETTRRMALVTGAGRGIGAACAVALADAGCDVVVNYRSDEASARAVAQRVEAAGGRAWLRAFDVSDRAATRAALDALQTEVGGVDIVVANAGVTADAPFPAISDEDWDRVLTTSLGGFFNVVQPLVMPMVRRRFGRVIAITSVSGVQGNRGQANYAAAKSGIHGAVRSIAKEVARRGVTANCVAPGMIDTDATRALDPEVVQRAVQATPAGRMGTPEEVAGLVAYLASAQASYVTGQVIGVNGGLA